MKQMKQGSAQMMGGKGNIKRAPQKMGGQGNAPSHPNKKGMKGYC